MKTELSSLEIRVLADELKGIVGARVQKIFQEKNMMHLSMHVPGQGTKTLLVGDGKIFLSKYRLVHSDVPTNFAMYLRKYCKNQRIKNVYQHDFERIVIIEMDEYKLIVELFSKGNVIFADKDNSIWSVLERQLWSSRSIKQKEAYVFPPRGIDPTALTGEVFLKALLNSDKQIVAFLARELSLGGTFAEEVCLMAKIDKKKTCNT
ncbi:MAG: NFACT family protein, partial [archaeon]